MINPSVLNKQSMVYWIIGKTVYNKHYFESDYNVVANEFVNNGDDIHVKGMYKENNNTMFANLVNFNENDWQDLLEETQNNTIESRLYKLSIGRKVTMYETPYQFIGTYMIHIAKMEVYELHRKIESIPGCELAGVKTDCSV